MTQQRLNNPELPADHPINLLPASAMSVGHAFAPKLDFHQRCEVYALALSGVSRNLLAIAYNLNRRTINHMCNPASSRYRDVRSKHAEMGHKAFVAAFATKDATAKVQRYINDPAVKATWAEADDKGAAAVVANRRSNKHEGINKVHCGDFDCDVRINIRWKDAGQPRDNDGNHPAPHSGWYYELLDPLLQGDTITPGLFAWFGLPDDLRTSTTMLRAFESSVNTPDND